MKATLNLTNEFTELRKAFNCPEKYVCIAAGRRTGKTHEAFDWIYNSFLGEGVRSALWVDTKHSNIDKYVERYCIQRLEAIWKHCNYNQQKKVLTFPNGAILDFGSAERAENLEGFQYDRVVINEAGIALKRSSLWDNTIMPMTKGDNNRTRILGTPKGRNKFFQLSNQYKLFRFKAYESPYWNKEELDVIKTQVPEMVWRQEYMAEFIEEAGAVFRNITNCIKGEFLSKGKDDTDYIMGVDLAKHVDFTVIIIAERNAKQVVYMDRFNQIDWTLQKQRIIAAWKRFNRPSMIIDSTGVGDSVYDDLVSLGVNVTPYRFTSASKEELIRNLSISLEGEEIYFPHDQDIISELEMYEYEQLPSGKFRYSAPDNYHDDIVISLSLVNHLLNKGGFGLLDYYKQTYGSSGETGPQRIYGSLLDPATLKGGHQIDISSYGYESSSTESVTIDT